MPTRRATLAATAAAVAGCIHDGDGDGAEGSTIAPATGSLAVTSRAFEEGDAIPPRFSCDGADVSPPLTVDGVPASAASLALVVDDPDAPTDEPFVHWLLWNVPAEATVGIPPEVPDGETVAALDGARQGTNDMDEVGYGGPCPPGDETHTYRFRVYALAERLDVATGADRDALASAMEGLIEDAGRLTGTYRRA